MIVQRFLAWVQQAPAGARAEATSALARAFLYSDLGDRDRADAETALTSMLDDPSPLVRRALAEAFASASEAPHHCVSALARDQSDIAAIVLARSPLLTDAELIDCAGIGDIFSQSAIALRPGLSAKVATALVEAGAREALISLAVNTAADIPDALLGVMIERHGADGEIREAILSRPGLPQGLRASLVRATASALQDFVVGRDWMPRERAERMARESSEKGVIIIAAESRSSRPGPELAHALRRAGALTPGLALRAILSGAPGFFVAMLAELSGLPPARVAGLVNRPDGTGFAALCARAKLPPDLVPAFRLALSAGGGEKETAGRLSRAHIARLRGLCESSRPPVASGELLSLLRQFESEAARDDARRMTAQLVIANAPRAPSPPVIHIDLAAFEADLAAA